MENNLSLIEIQGYTLPVIEFNEKVIIEEIEKITRKFENLIFTPETAKECNQSITELNKMYKSVDEFRIKYKKIIIVPVDKFENKCNMIKEYIEKPLASLKKQANDFKKLRMIEKEKVVDLMLKDFKESSHLSEKFWNQIVCNNKWLNDSFSKSDISKEIVAQINHLIIMQKQEEEKISFIKTQIEILNEKYELIMPLVLENLFYLLDDDLSTISITLHEVAGRQKENEMLSMEKVLEKEREDIKKEAVAEERINNAKCVKNLSDTIANILPEESETNAKVSTYLLKITGTKEQNVALKKYLELAGMTFERVMVK